MPSTLFVNGRFLDRPITGVERFGREVLAALAIELADRPAGRRHDLVVVRPASANAPFEVIGLPQPLREIRAGNRGSHYWEQLTLPRLTQQGLLLNLCNTGPLLARQSVVCVHDAHVWKQPENYSFAFRTWYHLLIPLLLDRASAWVTVSNYSARSLIQAGAARHPAAAIIPNAPSAIFIQPPLQDDTEAMPDQPYVLCVASHSQAKNFDLIAAIAPALVRRGIKVLAVGDGNVSVFEGKSLATSDITFLGRVDDAALATLYRKASAFLFPSREEGFGLPPIEAMASGCPVISSNTSAMPDVLGDAAILLSPDDQQGWEQAIVSLIDDQQKRNELVAAGRDRAARYSWRTSAQRLLDVIEQIPAQGGPNHGADNACD